MRKISTLFKKNPDDLSLVTEELDLQNNWVFERGVLATRKWDGTACFVVDGYLYKRYDVKADREFPIGAIPCQEPDPISGHWPHWLPINQEGPDDRYFLSGYYNYVSNYGAIPDGTYELVGPKINGNRERLTYHQLVKHGDFVLYTLDGFSYKEIETYLATMDIEGIVFHHPDGRMCKIRKSDFGLKRTLQTV